MQHGFQRLVLLGSAGYSRAELPLDGAVSLVAPNNTGKTSLIHALASSMLGVPTVFVSGVFHFTPMKNMMTSDALVIATSSATGVVHGSGRGRRFFLGGTMGDAWSAFAARMRRRSS